MKLRKIDKDNWEICINLSVSAEQNMWISKNCYNLLDAHYGKNIYPLAIYDGNHMVGLLIYDRDPKTKHWELKSIMIDQNEQNKGYGKAGLSMLIEKMHREHRKAVFYAYITRDNPIAAKTYESVGFRTTGVEKNGKVEYTLQL